MGMRIIVAMQGDMKEMEHVIGRATLREDCKDDNPDGYSTFVRFSLYPSFPTL